MSQVLNFISVARPEKARARIVPRGDEVDEFWPEVSRHDSGGDETPVDPATSPEQVLSEAAVWPPRAAKEHGWQNATRGSTKSDAIPERVNDFETSGV